MHTETDPKRIGRPHKWRHREKAPRGKQQHDHRGKVQKTNKDQ